MTLHLPGGETALLVAIPPGAFTMGSPESELGREDDEGPTHTVTIDYCFWLGQTEVTQAQWLAVMGEWPENWCYPAPQHGLGDDYPVYCVSYNDIAGPGGFLDTLNAHLEATGQGMTLRLPSESEWEYGCRAGTTSRFYFGDSLGCAGDCSDCAAGALPGVRADYMWYCGDESPSGCKPVAGKLPNAFGLCDMSGNVHELLEDDWHDDYIGAPTDGSPRTMAWHAACVMRGGQWDNSAKQCRSAKRYPFARDSRLTGVGFRLAAGH